MIPPEKPKSNARVIWPLALVVMGMFAFGFLLVPLYDAFCELTGVNVKVKNKAASETAMVVDTIREVSVEFITTLNQGMPLSFRAESQKIRVHPGQYYTVKFYGENLTGAKLVGQAIPSIAPGSAEKYLKKTECFCFSKQEFEPHKLREMPVRFVIDPALPDDVKDMTLSYTFFDITNKKPN